MAIETEKREDVIIFRLGGPIIGPSVEELRREIDSQLTHISHSPKLLFDFADVSAMDSSGLGVLMGAHVSILPKGGRIAVINVDKHVKNLIVVARLITVFEHFSTEGRAMTALTKSKNPSQNRREE